MKRTYPAMLLSAFFCAIVCLGANDLPVAASASSPAAMATLSGPAELAASATGRLALASSLRDSGEYSLSALEYRRMAADLEPGDPAIPSLHLAAADAYRLQRRWDRMGKMLDAAEDAASEISNDKTQRGENAKSFTESHLFLRLRRAEGLKDWTSAAYYAEDLANCGAVSPESDDPETARIFAWASHAAAANHLRAGNEAAARAAVTNDQERTDAIDRYASSHRKSPTVGGFLGIIPGLGYAYSGEWGNMFRSIFLNGIFGWAMFECADHDRWGLFAITAFFEATWFTGSIYGGIDAAHRYNRTRLQETTDAIMDGPSPELRPDPAIGFFSMRLSF